MNLYIWPTLLLAAALILIFIEVFVPSAGLIPLMAFGLFLTAIWNAFNVSLTTGLIFLTIALAMIPFTILAAASIWPHTWIAQFFMLKPPGVDEPRPTMDEPGSTEDLKNLIGASGQTITDLRPGGTVLINNKPFDSITDEGFLPTQIQVRVIGVRQSQLLVRKTF